ncbi:DUF6807 family protein [Georgenia sp. H159]|uniref:DUF6807 family protein n=1 Tax=Georgenia sp. H159 TaxID=3076115 RepID=UPI002D78127B|nr:DUF6807 family protein [Georgenia sp. H159]
MTDASTPMGPSSPLRRFRVALAGANGYGLHHLRALQGLVAAGRCELVGVADTRAPEGESRELVGSAPHFTALTELLAATAPDVVIIATPIDTHAELAATALRAGSHVLLEKPPTASLAEFTALLDLTEETGLACQVGFQSFGSHAFAEIARIVGDGEIGEVTGVGGVGTWLRSTDYYARSRWAGRRRLDGRDVVDGVLTNPLAHAVATALRVAGARRREDVAALELDLFHAHDIEADDTSSVRVVMPDRTPVALGLTLAAARQTVPRVIVHGTRGAITLSYTTDEIEVDGRGGRRRLSVGRTPLVDNLLDHLTDATVPLLSPLADSGAFMTVLEAVRTAPDPAPVPAEHVTWTDDDAGRHPVVHDVEHWCERVGHELRTFTALGAPWAPRHRDLASLDVAGTAVATYVDGSGTSPLDSPRPHLHPVRTRGGVVVTDSAPADHTWHAGVGVAVQDVAGHNLWGGRTYLRGEGYQWRSDHGRITHERWQEQSPGHLVEHLAWRAHDDRPLLRETRRITWAEQADAWQLTLSFTLHNDSADDVALGSPGSNGRPAGGYGGYFWRLPACDDVDVRTATHRGEDEVHGTTAPWLAWSARADGGDFTIALAPDDDVTAADPWFVRVAGYPGIGSALAWDSPVVVPAGGSVTRSVRAVVADGRLTDDEVVAALRA